jgi:hypothetical protein
MNAIERRVTEALHTYGEGLEMTAQDVDRLEHRLEAKQKKDLAAHRLRRTRLLGAAVAACAVTGVVLGALALRNDMADRSQPAAPPVTLAQLQGLWRVDGSDWLWRFTSDGRLVMSNRPDLLTATVPVEAPVVRPAPGGFTMSDPATPGCPHRWSASISADGHLQATEPPESAACPGSDGVAGRGASWSLVRVSPASVAGLSATPNFEAMDPTKVAFENQDRLRGTWLLRGTGTVLTVVENEYPQDVHTFTYAVQDLAASTEPRTGTMRARLNGQVLFWPPDGTAPPCTIEYESVVTRNSSLEAKLAASSCDQLGGSTDTWIRLN